MGIFKRTVVAHLLGATAVLLTACATAEPYDPPPADAGDPCETCWAWCSAKERTSREVILCAPYCTEVCGVDP